GGCRLARPLRRRAAGRHRLHHEPVHRHARLGRAGLWDAAAHRRDRGIAAVGHRRLRRPAVRRARGHLGNRRARMTSGPFSADLDDATRALLARGIEELRSGQARAAAATLRQVLERAPDQPEALQLLGVAVFQSGRGDEAVRLLQRAVAVAPDNLEAHYNLANVFLLQDRLREAEAGFRRVLALNARHFDAQLNLSGTLSRMGRLTEATAACRAALDIDPRNAVAHHNLGELYREQGQYEAAVHALEQAVKADPGNAQYRANLRDTYRRTIPGWHFAMLNDQARNDAFERAIPKAAPGRRLVLDIGTGSGLLAMMAARARAAPAVAS